MDDKLVRRTISIPVSIAEQIDELSRKEDRSFSNMVSRILKKYLDAKNSNDRQS